MATTTNYSWTTPDDTALVKDGAAAIRSLGTAIDTTVFNNAGAAIAKTIVDAKGDLIVGTAADTVARLASSASNGNVLTVDTSTASGLKWAAPSSTTFPTFRTYRSGSNQSFSSSTWTKVQLNSEDWDPDNCFDPTTNYRFTPTSAGYYQFNATINLLGASLTEAALSVYKNGSNAGYLVYLPFSGIAPAICGSTMLYLNGTTDYAELYVYAVGSGLEVRINNTGFGTWFTGVGIRS